MHLLEDRMDIKFSNNASTYLIEAITPESTLLRVAPPTMFLFPALDDATDYFMLTLGDSNANLEIVKVVSRDDVEATFTVERAQEGTAALDFPINSMVEHRLTAGSLMHVLNEIAASTTEAGRIRIATEDEVLEGIVDDACLVPAHIKLFGVPKGFIQLYSGNTLDGHPVDEDGVKLEEYHICDGTNGTPDLRDKFVIGASTEHYPHTTGGSNDPHVVHVSGGKTGAHALTIYEIPPHWHYAHQATSMNVAPGGFPGAAYGGYNNTSIDGGTDGGTLPHAHDMPDVDFEFSALPSYYALTYVMKII